jgi:hypothetical protein
VRSIVDTTHHPSESRNNGKTPLGEKGGRMSLLIITKEKDTKRSYAVDSDQKRSFLQPMDHIIFADALHGY